MGDKKLQVYFAFKEMMEKVKIVIQILGYNICKDRVAYQL